MALSEKKTMAMSEKAVSQDPVQFTLSRSTLKGRYTVDEGTKPGSTVYHADLHHVSPSKPTVELRARNDKTSPILAFAKIGWKQRNATLALGNPESDAPDSIVYTGLKETSCAYSMRSYEVETDEGLDGRGEQRTYIWERPSASAGHFQCLDAESGQVVATYRSFGFLRTRPMGSVEMVADASPRFRQLLFLCLVVLKDMEMKAWSGGGAVVVVA